MPNPIKYTTGSETNALKKGNFYIGTGDVGKGPSDTTGFYQGISPSSGGYVIYMNKSGAPGDLSYHNAPTDAELISFTNSLAGQSYTTVNECLTYYAGQSDKVCVNRDYEGIVTDGLIFNLDAGFTPSYPTSGTTWYDISLSGNNGTLINGPTFSTDGGGTIIFDGTNDYATVPHFTDLNVNNNITIESWVQISSDSGFRGIFGVFTDTPPFLGYSFALDLNVTKLQFLVGFGSGAYKYITANSNYVKNQWYHIVGTIGGGYSLFYVNGVLQNDSTQVSIEPPGNLPITIGRFYYDKNNYYLNGKIASSRIYNRALSASEVLQNYNAQKGRFGL